MPRQRTASGGKNALYLKMSQQHIVMAAFVRAMIAALFTWRPARDISVTSHVTVSSSGAERANLR